MTLTEVLKDLNSPRAKLVYYYIYKNEVVNVDDICNYLDEMAISVYPILKYLSQDKKVIEKVDHRYIVK